MSLLVRAFDPGPTRTAYAVLLAEPNDKLSVIKTGMVQSWGDEVVSGIVEQDGGLVAIESLSGYLVSKARFKTLMQTAEVIGRLRHVALAHGFEPYMSPANAPRGKPHWRFALTGFEGAGDAAVLRALKLLFGKDIGQGKENHELDALGLAVVAARVNWRKHHVVGKR